MINLLRLPWKAFCYMHKRLAPLTYAKLIGVTIGLDCRLINVDFGSEPYLVSIGNHFSGTNVRFITHDGGVWVFRREFPELDVVAPISVGNNVFMGSGVTVLPGVTIGDNVVIGAGSVVSRSIPSNCVAAGVPARTIRHLDEYKTRCLNKGKPTKRLSPTNKRQYYQSIFKNLERDTHN